MRSKSPAAERPVKAFNVNDVSLAKKKKELLERIHLDFASALAATLANYISVPSKISLSTIRQSTYEAYQKETARGSLFSFFEIEPTGSHAIMRLESPLVLVAIDRILGGAGNLIEARELSVIETKMAEALMGKVLNQLNAAWEMFGEFSFKLKSNSQTSSAFRFLSAEDPVLVVSFQVQLQQTSGMLDVCFPFMFVKPFLSTLEKSEGHALGDLSDPKICRALQGRFEHLQVRLRVLLGQEELTLQEITALECGDVIRLESTEKSLVVLADHIPVFQAMPGSFNKKMAVQILGAVFPPSGS